MAFQQNTPRKTNKLTPSADLATEGIVQIPDEESAQEHEQAITDHEPHGLERLDIALILVLLLFLGGDWDALFLACGPVLLASVAPAWSQCHFHGVHAAQDNDDSQERIRVLVKYWVLKVVVVEGDEDS